MKLQGSCHCGAVKFELESHTPYPQEKCYCSICRKTAGGAGYAIHIMGEANTLKIKGRDNIKEYRAKIKNPEDKKAHLGTGKNCFCKRCGSALWKYDPQWPDMIYPLAAAIDTPLPSTDEHTHLLTEFAASWVMLPKATAKQRVFKRYPDQSIEQWHKSRNKYVD